jgi:hypothetical protein
MLDVIDYETRVPATRIWRNTNFNLAVPRLAIQSKAHESASFTRYRLMPQRRTNNAGLCRLMISHCANPDCGVPLRRLRDGRLFQFEITSNDGGESQSKPGNRGKSSRHVAHFWLCGKCSPSFTLVVDPKRGVAMVPLYSAKSVSSSRS